MAASHRVFVAALALSCALSLPTTPAAAADKVSVGVVGSFSDAPIFIAQDKGYFAAAGVALDFESMDSITKMIAPLGAGQLDVGGGAISAGLYNAVGRDITMRVVADKGRNAPGYGYNALLVRKDLWDSGAVKSIADLKGRKIATIGIGTIDASVLNKAMQSVGLAYKDIEQIALPLPDHPVAQSNRAVDATLTPEPFATQMVERGIAVKLATVDQFYPNQQQAILLFGGEFTKNRRAVAQKFLTAYIRGARDFVDALKDGKIAGKGADEVIRIIMNNTRIKDADLLRRMTPNYVDPNGQVNFAGMKTDWEFLKQAGFIQANTTPQDIIDMSFAEAAVKELGPYRKPE